MSEEHPRYNGDRRRANKEAIWERRIISALITLAVAGIMWVLSEVNNSHDEIIKMEGKIDNTNLSVSNIEDDVSEMRSSIKELSQEVREATKFYVPIQTFNQYREGVRTQHVDYDKRILQLEKNTHSHNHNSIQ